MRTLLGLVGVVVMAVLAVLAWNWWNTNNAQLMIAYPNDGAVLTGNTVPVKLVPNQEIKTKVTQPGSPVAIITYLDGKEISRGKEFDYSLTAIAPGQHKLEIGLADETKDSGVSLYVMPKPV